MFRAFFIAEIKVKLMMLLTRLQALTDCVSKFATLTVLMTDQ